jgi:[glutamine synthetase] adenylyltransferase / [glutamine synthetase]-adenylyl-L-tyrosine phosphorylase
MSGRNLEFPDVLEYSRFARGLVDATPDIVQEARELSDTPWSRASMQRFIASAAVRDATELGTVLRRLRSRVMMRTMARDLSGAATLEEVCSTVTALAEVSIEAAQDAAERSLHAQFGEPRAESDGTPQRLIVVGMGKLGGGELNVSSDIDLIFVYPEEGETAGGPRSLSNHEFFVRLGRRIIQLLNEPTADGRVFRVDMRLRPWGDAGPLATSFDALENYLVAHGRQWERYAWIKGRALTGADHGALDAIVRPFVYRKYLDYGSFAAMRELHAEVRAEVARRELADHVKLGPGGIREVEFIAQAYQLIRGGREAALRIRPTCDVLALLASRGLLEPEAERHLREAYVHLRQVEHRLQYLDDAQTHALPEADADRALLARAMGCADWDAFRATLDAHRNRVSAHFERIFAAQDAPRHRFAALWTTPSSSDATGELAALGFRDPQAAAMRLRSLRGGSRYVDLPESSKTRLEALVPRMIEEAVRHPNPDETLARCLDLVETVSRRAAYVALMDEHPAALARIADLLSASSWASEYLMRHPIVLDELLDPRVLHAESNWLRFADALRAQLMDSRGDSERQMDLLREAHHGQIFRLLVQDLAGVLSVERLADDLSELADAVLQVTLELCWEDLRKQFPARNIAYPARFPRFAVVGYGKLGGKELGYASDLDIIFLYDDAHENAAEVYARLGQRLNLWLTSRTGAGVLFETDLRLRPEGASGLLVSSMDAFRRYQRESAWTWEHQALSRARYCAGDADVGAQFENERRLVLRTKRDEARLRADVLDMRRQLLEGHPNRSELFDLKHDRGGMIDIEFIVQYLVLAHAHAHPELVLNNGNIALLGMAAGIGLIPDSLAGSVAAAYRDYRRRQHALRLNGARYARVQPEEFAGQVDATLALWQHVLGDIRG